MRGSTESSRGAQRAARWLAIACSAAALVAGGCGGNSNTGTDANAIVDTAVVDAPSETSEPGPEISVLIDGVTPVDNACAHFAVDDTGGVIYQTKKLTITNTGSVGTLCLNAITLTSTETNLISIAYGTHKVDEDACPGAFASLEPGKSLVATLEYAPSPGIMDSATLTIDHNDHLDKKKFADLCFDVAVAPPSVSLKTQQLMWVNPKTSVPTAQCAEIGNNGGQPLAFTALATISPTNPEYTITAQPKVTDSIDAM